ncbi:MAG: hypothetical protein V4629_03925 [Pseudomonadota bacterium]
MPELPIDPQHLPSSQSVHLHPVNAQIDLELLEDILRAAYQTALRNRGEFEEMYALGALEAISNTIYLSIYDRGYFRLESTCQEYAAIAIERMEEVTLEARFKSISSKKKIN